MSIRLENNDRLLVEAVVDYAIYTLDPNGYVSNGNAGAERIKGYRAEEIIGSHYSCVIRKPIGAAPNRRRLSH